MFGSTSRVSRDRASDVLFNVGTIRERSRASRKRRFNRPGSPRKNFYLSIRSESDNSVDYEMCSSDHGRLRCVRFESVRSATTALSGESGATIWRRSDRYRKEPNPTFCKTSACYSAEINAVSAANTQAVAWVTRGFSLVFPESIEPTHGMKASCPTNPSETWRRGRESNPRIAVLQTATLPLGYPAELRERTISL
jgi:hypothetical protein